MRLFRGAACAGFVLLSSLLVAETHQHRQRHVDAASCHIAQPKGRRSKAGCGKSAAAPANAVVIYNGNQRQTRTFNAANDPARPVRNLSPVVIGISNGVSTAQHARPVVVGISSDAGTQFQPVVLNVASSGSNAQPVVLGVASTGFQTASAVEPVALAVSPRPPKRPPYRPAVLDAQ